MMNTATAMPMMGGMMPQMGMPMMMPMMNNMMGGMPGMMPMPMMMCRMSCEMGPDGTMMMKMMPMDPAQMAMFKACCESMMSMMGMGMPCMMMCGGMMCMCMPMPKAA